MVTTREILLTAFVVLLASVLILYIIGALTYISFMAALFVGALHVMGRLARLMVRLNNRNQEIK